MNEGEKIPFIEPMRKYIHAYLQPLIMAIIIIVLFVIKLKIAGVQFLDYLGEVAIPFFMTVPLIFLILLYYFLNRYYQAIFVMTRIGSLDYAKKTYHRAIMKDTYLIVGSEIVGVLLFEWLPYSWQTFYARVICLSTLASIYILFAMVHIFLIEHYPYRVSFVCESLYIVFLVEVLHNIYCLPRMLYLSYKDNYPLLFINLIAIAVFYFVISKQKEISTYITRISVVIACEAFASIMLKQFIPQDFSLYHVFLPTSVDRFLFLILWLFPKIILILVCVKETDEMYGRHLLFYLVRIKNRRKWLIQLYRRLITYIIMAAVTKMVSFLAVSDKYLTVLLYSAVSYICMMLMLISVFVFFTCVCHDQGIINGALVIYMMISYCALIFDQPVMHFFANVNQVSIIVGCVSVSLIMIFLELIIMNKMEYYGGLV